MQEDINIPLPEKNTIKREIRGKERAYSRLSVEEVETGKKETIWIF